MYQAHTRSSSSIAHPRPAPRRGSSRHTTESSALLHIGTSSLTALQTTRLPNRPLRQDGVSHTITSLRAEVELIPATLSYDRLGVGKSSKPDGTQIVQIPFEIAQSAAIAASLRAGTFADLGAFETIVGVGHSYGSALLVGVASVAPDAFDQLILTGFSGNSTVGPLGVAGFDSTIASVAYPDRFAADANDYLSTPSVSIDQKEFFHYPNYTQSALDLFTTTKGEYTLGQINSIAIALPSDRSAFTKPVFVITGENDAPFCDSNCNVTSLPNGQTQLDTAKELFPSVADANFSTQIVPATGHGINFRENLFDARDMHN